MSTISPHLRILIQLSRIDGDASAEELTLIREIGSNELISEEALSEAMNESADYNHLSSIEDFIPEEKVDLIYNLVLMILADGKIEISEMGFCFSIVEKLGIPSNKFIGLVHDSLNNRDFDIRANIKELVNFKDGDKNPTVI